MQEVATIIKSRAIPRERLLREENTRFKIIFFVIWPVASFVHALHQLRSRSSLLIIMFFYGLCGFFHPFSFKGNFDVVRHANRFMETTQEPIYNFFARLGNLYTSDEYKPDLLQPFIEFLVSRFTNDFRIYFTVLALIMAFFLVKLVGTVARETIGSDKVNGGLVWLSLILIIILISPYRFSGFRQITALLVFCYGANRVLMLEDKRYHWLVLSSCFIHFSFLAILPFYAIYFFVGNRVGFYFLLIGTAFYLSEVATETFGEIAVNLEGQLGQRVRGYSSADYREYISTAGQHQNFLVANQLKYTAWFFFALQAIYYFYREKFFGPAIKSLYCMSLCIFSFVILMKGIETSFLRFALLYIIFSAVFCAHLFSKLLISSYLVRFMFYGIVAINTLIMLRKTIEFTGVQVLSPNLLIIFFIDTDKSILNLFK